MWQIYPTKNWEELRNHFTWIQDMEGVLQDEIYHAEGDVAVHTKMVMEALLKLPEYEQLAKQEQEILFAAALLHDVEKRSTTFRGEDGRITSPKHAIKGAYTTQSILYQSINTPFNIRQTISKLVRYHGLPLWFLEKRDTQRAVLKAAEEVNLRYLYLLAKADVLGRICADQGDLLYKVELFKEYCKEQNCWGQAYPFVNANARFTYFNKVESSLFYVPFEKETFVVTILSALPGSGKDFYLSKNYPDLPVVSLDDLRRQHKIDPKDKKGNGRVIQMVKEMAKVYLRKQQPLVWNATNITRQMREQLIDLMTTYGAKVCIIYIEVPYHKLLQQNQNRDFPIPVKVLHKMQQKLEVPQAWEAHEVIYEVE